MAEFLDRELYLVKKALAIAVLAIERQPGPFQSASDQADMKDMLDRLVTDDAMLAYTPERPASRSTASLIE